MSPESDEDGDLGLSRSTSLSLLDEGGPLPNTSPNITPKKRRIRPPHIRLPSRRSTSSGGATPALTSPSSPDLNVMNHLQSLSLSPSASSGWGINRSRTLPRLRMKPTTSLEADVQPTPLEDATLLRMRRWILCLAIINFDLDIGPVVDMLYPPVRMGAPERENVAFSSFPDTALFDTGSQVHSFRLRDPIPPGTPPGNETRPASLDGFLYGYTLFHQRRDASSKRGYLQRSVVILSHRPYPSLFLSALSTLGPLYFSQGAPSLEAACHNIAKWPDPTPGSSCELGFMGSVLMAELPFNASQQQSEHTHGAQRSQVELSMRGTFIMASIPPLTPSPLRLFAAFLPKLWSIWECLVMCEPVILFATSPCKASLAIWWLCDLLRPLPPTTDFRPYFHIHDRDFDQLVNKKAPKAGLLLGVTNPFFESACKHWPHVLSVADALSSTKSNSAHEGTATKLTPHIGPIPGFHSKHQRYTSKDRVLLKSLEEALQKGGNFDIEAIHTLRHHFSTRASQLLVPLNRYFTSLIPRTATPSSSSTPAIKTFAHTEFMASLKAHGTPLPFRSRSKQKEFYERWTRTPAFGLWLAERDAETREALSKKHTK